jgi:hypothetical protein
MKRTIFLSAVRHFVTIAAGALATQGYIDGSQAEVLVGAVLGLAGIGWSVLEKSARNRA